MWEFFWFGVASFVEVLLLRIALVADRPVSFRSCFLDCLIRLAEKAGILLSPYPHTHYSTGDVALDFTLSDLLSNFVTANNPAGDWCVH